MATNEEFEVCTFNKYKKGITKLADWLKSSGCNSIYGIPRGGLIIAVHLSNKTGLPLIMNKDDITNKTIIVDDISDTGKTLTKLYKQLTCRPAVITLYYKDTTDAKPNACVYEKKKKWVKFWWEI